jgi:hypothetical protein
VALRVINMRAVCDSWNEDELLEQVRHSLGLSWEGSALPRELGEHAECVCDTVPLEKFEVVLTINVVKFQTRT